MKITSCAPGRICLFGDHQDYLGLPIIACAVDRSISLIAIPNSTKTLDIHFKDLGKERSIPLSETYTPEDHEDFLVSALRVAQRYGFVPATGYHIEITGTIPMNAGLSSSSALVVAWCQFLGQTMGKEQMASPELVAQMSYEAEVAELGNPGGKMDQYSIGLGNIIYLETGAQTYFETIGHQLEGLVVGESGIAKDTLGLLADRKTLAIASIKFLQEQEPGFEVSQVDSSSYKSYEDRLLQEYKPYFYAAVHNHLITQQAVSEFKKSPMDLNQIGHLMSQHHTILKDILQITVPRIDAMVDAALEAGALGAKIVGSGGGGCIVALAPGNEAKVTQALMRAGAANAYPVSIAPGARP